MSQFHQLRVLERRDEVADACSLILEKPPHFDYQAGQHLPIRFQINGKEARRTYTLSSSPMDEHLKITVKRVQGGLVSNYINDHLNSGTMIEARPPIGHIFVQCHPHTYRTYYLFAAGSGITPMYSILRTVLAQEPHSHIRLFYGNRNEDSILFRQELEQLAQQHANRFQIVYTLSQPLRDSWSALWRNDLMNDARKGRIDEEAVRWFIDTHRPVAQDAAYYVCGPGSMNETVQATLRRLHVPEEDIHIEYFQAPENQPIAADVGIVDNAQATVLLNGEQFVVSVPKGRTILQAVLDVGYQPPYSCEAGICATCRGRLVEGAVHMPSASALERKEIQSGVVLTCQAYPTVGEVVVRYD